MIKKFEIGKTYQTRLIGDHELTESITIASRTASFVTTTEGKRLGINKKRTEYAGAECVMPDGVYSMAPCISADKEMAKRKLTLADKYKIAKDASQGATLFFICGDFAELFFDDAKTMSKVLGLTLTTRCKTDAEPIAMAGFPKYQLDSYLPKLVKLGYRVAVIDTTV